MMIKYKKQPMARRILMKRTMLHGFFIVLLMSSIIFGACASSISDKTTEVPSGAIITDEQPSFYRNGRFIGYSDASDHGYAMAVVTIENDKIVDVILKEFTELSVEKDFSTYEYTPSVRAHEELPAMFVAAGNSLVEAISGATASSDRYRQAVERAMKSAEKNPAENSYFDGTFQGRSRSDNHGYGIALVTIKDDKIIVVELKEVDERGEFKDFETYPHEPSREAHREIPKRFIEKNSPNIDVFTGATHSSEKYIEAVTNALYKATIDRPLPDLFDGTYLGISDSDASGHAEALVTIENSTIADVILVEYDEELRERDMTSSSYDPIVNAFKELPWAFIQTQSPNIDIVTGATRSCKLYIQAVERALQQAKW